MPLNATLSPQRGTGQENKKSQQFISAPSILQGSGDCRGGSPPSAPSAARSLIVHPEVPSHISGPPPLGPPSTVGRAPRDPQSATRRPGRAVPSSRAGQERNPESGKATQRTNASLGCFCWFCFFFFVVGFFFFLNSFFYENSSQSPATNRMPKGNRTENKNKRQKKPGSPFLSIV